MRNVIIYLAVFYIFYLSGCEKSHNLKENCYQAKVLNSNECGRIVQIVAGGSSFENSTWVDNNGNKKQRSYLVKNSLKGYIVGQAIYVQVKNVMKTPEQIIPAICQGLPDYSLEIEIVNANCELVENKM